MNWAVEDDAMMSCDEKVAPEKFVDGDTDIDFCEARSELRKCSDELAQE